MRRLEAIAILSSQAEALKSLGATSLYLFGSTARDEAGQESDVDVFIDYDQEHFGFAEFFRIRDVLETATHAKIDLATRASLHPALKGAIEAEAIRVI